MSGKNIILITALILLLFIVFSRFHVSDDVEDGFHYARENSRQANEAFVRSNKALRAWMSKTDRHLFPEDLRFNKSVWTAVNSAADLYPFLVISAYYTDRTLLDDLGKTLETEVELSDGGLPVSYDLTAGRVVGGNRNRPVYGASEYVKDGLLAITEVMGRNEWYDRMLDVEEIIFWDRHLPTGFSEVDGEQLQVLSRLYSATKNPEYLEWAEEIGDVYVYEILPDNSYMPCRFWNLRKKRCVSKGFLGDHGNEIIPGLLELYVIEKNVDSSRRQSYREHIKRMLDRILEYRNEDGVFYETAEKDGLTDNWGYLYTAYYVYCVIENETRYCGEIERTLENICRYSNYTWESDNMDGYADTIESVLYFINRIPAGSCAQEFIDHSIQRMYAFQNNDGFIERYYVDGNFIRTALMYGLYKTQGTYVDPFEPGLKLGGYRINDTLYVYMESDSGWRGKLRFDYERHRRIMDMPFNYPRVNAFPEWYAVKDDLKYNVTFVDEGRSVVVKGGELINGIDVEVSGVKRIKVNPS